jgi:hypothetical protein
MKIAMISQGIAAIDLLLADNDARIRGINSGTTYSEALVANRTDNSSCPNNGDVCGSARRSSDTVAAELVTINDLLNAVSAITHRAIGNLSDVPFSTLKSEGVSIQNDLTRLIAETTQVKAQTTSNIALIQPLIKTYDDASSTGTSTIAIKQTQQDAAFAFMKLMQSGILTPPFILTAKRVEWTGRLQ